MVVVVVGEGASVLPDATGGMSEASGSRACVMAFLLLAQWAWTW